MYVFHDDQWQGVSRIDPVTREAEYTKLIRPSWFSAPGFDVYRNQPCLVGLGGLWCMNEDGSIDQKMTQESAVGVLFAPSSDAGD